ncbi:MAG: DinB family protein [Gammaproteobacteria bacterium]|nr:DinB family protein [Gammaproteobacteria bacterium]
MNELQRFLSLFDHQVKHTLRFVEHVPQEAWTSVPVEGDFMFLGTRVARITIAALLKHLLIAESHWFERLATVRQGDSIPLPLNTTSLSTIEDGPQVIDAYRERHESALRGLASFSNERLATEFTFVGRHFTVMGLLWMVLSHHGFHLGQVDLLMRQNGLQPIEFLEWAETEKVVG